MSINIILATDKNFGIGKENALPWPRNQRDMDWFRKNTTDGVVVMGRKTWESIGSRKLPNRTNVVVTSKNIEGPDITMFGDMKGNLEYLERIFIGKDIWIMGGAEIYSQCIPLADYLYLTTFPDSYECDAYVESDIIVEYPVVEYWEEKIGDIAFQIRKRL